MDLSPEDKEYALDYIENVCLSTPRDTTYDDWEDR